MAPFNAEIRRGPQRTQWTAEDAEFCVLNLFVITLSRPAPGFCFSTTQYVTRKELTHANAIPVSPCLDSYSLANYFRVSTRTSIRGELLGSGSAANTTRRRGAGTSRPSGSGT